MARTNFIQTSFRNGEWSPYSQGRIDADEYYAALNLCADFHPVDAGALVRRSGTEFVATIDTLQGGTSSYVQLIPFDTDDGEHYVCVLTPGNIQFFNAGTFVLEGSATTISSISQTGDPATFTTSSAHGLSAGDRVTITVPDGTDTGIARSLINVQLIVATAPTTTTFTATYADARSGDASVASADFCFHNGSAGKIKEVTLPYAYADLNANRVKHTQDSDFLYMFHPTYEPRLLGETLDLSTITFQDGPYYELNDTATTLTLSGTTGSVTVTASATTGINGGTGFVSTDVGRQIRFQDTGGNWTWLEITAYTSTTQVTATISGEDAGAATGVTTWRLGLYSDTTGWPTHGVFHELRLWLISDAQTSRIDGSKIIKYKETPDGVFSFEPTSQDGTIADNNAVAALFNSQGRNRLNWISTDDAGLMAGSSDGVWVVSASSLDDPITPTSIQARRKSLFKSSDSQPALVNRSTVFVGDLEKEVIEVRRYQGGYDAKNVSRDGEHLTADGLEEIYYANVPIPTLWARTSTKRLVGASFRRDVDGEQTGWHQHNLEYVEDPDKTNTEGNVEAITVVKKSDKDNSKIDTLWTVVERGGNYCLEYMTPLFDQSRIELEGWFVDSGVKYDLDNFGTAWNLTNAGTNEYTFYGLWHLEGKTVDFVWRGMDLGQLTVASGQVSVEIAEEALTAPSSYYQATDDFYRIKSYTQSYVTGFENAVSVTDYGETTSAPPPNGAQYCVGVDGNKYMMMCSNANATDLWLYDPVNDTTVQWMDSATHLAAIKDNGMDPLGLITSGGTGTGCGFVIEGTPYIVTMGQYSYTGGSPSAAYAVLYWKVNADDDVECVGGFVDKVDHTGVDLRPTNWTKMMAVGFLATDHSRYSSDIVLAYHDEENDYVAILRLPSVQTYDNAFGTVPPDGSVGKFIYFDTATSPNITDRIIEISEWGTNFFYPSPSGTSQDGPAQNRGFFAPTRRGSAWGVYLMTYISKDWMSAEAAGTLTPSNTFVNAQSTEYPDGLLAGVLYTADPSGTGGTVGSSEPMNCRIRDASADSIMPFADEGQQSDGTETDLADSYVNNPTLFETDPDDWLKPWLMFWPKSFYNEDDVDTEGTYVKLRVLEWNPVSGTATELYTKEGVTFNANTELGVSNVNNQAASTYVEWDRSTGQHTIIQYYLGAGIPLNGYTTFADFDGTTVDVDTDLLQMQDLTRGFDAVIGLNYAPRAQLLRPQRGSQSGPDLAKTRRIDQIGMILHRTGPFKLGTGFGADDMDNKTPSDEIESTGKRPLFTGVFHDRVIDDYSFDGQIAWEMDRPGPGSFLAVGGFRNTQDR